MSDVNDGFGDEPTQSAAKVSPIDPSIVRELQEIKANGLERSSRGPADKSGLDFHTKSRIEKIADELAGATNEELLEVLSGSAFITPSGKQAIQQYKGLGGAVGPILGMSPIEFATKQAENQGPDAGRAQGVSDVRYNLAVLTDRLLTAGWKRNSKIDQLVGKSGAVVEMGYVHGEVWARVFSPGAQALGRRPIYSAKMVTWDANDKFASSDEVYRAAANLDVLFLMTGVNGHLPVGTLQRDLAFAVVEQDTDSAFGGETWAPQLPTRTYPDDAGFDLYVAQTTRVEAGMWADVPLGVSVNLPAGIWARITGRSSTLKKRALLVQEGIIDTGYRGPLYAGCQNVGRETAIVEEGARIAQLILHENTTAGFRAVWGDMTPSDRGVSGFGSSGA